MLTLLDHGFVLAVVLLVPVDAARERRRLLHDLEAGVPLARLHAYTRAIAWQWGAAAVLMIGWLVLRRAPSLLGIAVPQGRGFLVATLIAAAIVIALAMQLSAVRRHPSLQAQVRSAATSLTWLLPATPSELRRFYALGCTAGAVEELVYRGFLMWYAGSLAPVGVALVLSSLAFGSAHLYQGASNAFKTMLVGLALGGLYWLSGSIWIPVAVHMAVDVLQGRMFYDAFREAATSTSGATPTSGTATPSQPSPA